MTKIEKCEPPSTAAKVKITSLNLHFTPENFSTRFWGWSKGGRLSQLVCFVVRMGPGTIFFKRELM